MPKRTKEQTNKETPGPILTPQEEPKKPHLSKKLGIILALVILILAGLYLAKGFLVAAIVNNHVITRYSLDKDLEKQGGKMVLENKITDLLVTAELSKQKVAVTQDEISQKVKEIEDQVSQSGQTLDQLLSSEGQTRKDLENQVKMRLEVEKLLAKDISVSDKDISDYFDTNKSYYPKGTKLEDKKEEIRTTLYQQKVTEKIQSWVDELKKKAKIYYFLKL